MSKVTLRPVLNGTDEEANGVLPEEGTPNVAMWQYSLPPSGTYPCAPGLEDRRPDLCRAWTGPSQWGASAIGKGNGYKMRPERKAGQGDHMGHSRPFWRPWALAGGRRGPRGGL